MPDCKEQKKLKDMRTYILVKEQRNCEILVSQQYINAYTSLETLKADAVKEIKNECANYAIPCEEAIAQFERSNVCFIDVDMRLEVSFRVIDINLVQG